MSGLKEVAGVVAAAGLLTLGVRYGVGALVVVFLAAAAGLFVLLALARRRRRP